VQVVPLPLTLLYIDSNDDNNSATYSCIDCKEKVKAPFWTQSHFCMKDNLFDDAFPGDLFQNFKNEGWRESFCLKFSGGFSVEDRV
jgi:hypothetical protein